MTTSFAGVLDHGATDRSVSADVIDLQLRTADALRERMTANSGAILGDEVGAGKTFVALALIADAVIRQPRRGALIFVPSGLLQTKWCRAVRDYLLAAVRDKKVARDLVTRITPIDRSLRNDGSLDPTRRGRSVRRNSIVVATYSVYSRHTRQRDQAACLRAAVATLPEGASRRPNRVLSACGLDPYSPADQGTWARPELLTLTVLRPLADILIRYGEGERDLQLPALEAIQEVRRRVGRRCLPDAALVVIDEAHNLKSTKSAIYRSLMTVLEGKFDELVLLTATPFQLGRSELLSIVDFFRASRRFGDRMEQFTQRRQTLSDAMDGYVGALERFGEAWSDLDPARGDAVALALSAVRDGACEPVVRDALSACRTALSAKGKLEQAMRPFIVRSLRVRDHEEHRGVPARYLSDDARIPLALVDRLLVEVMQESRTFVSSALVSACSSWEALVGASVMDGAGRAPSTARSVLTAMAGGELLGSHPKVDQTIDECVTAVGRGEKTLVFVEREATGRMLRDRIDTELERLSPDAEASVAAQLQRLQDRKRFGWASLRENYLSTLYTDLAGPPLAGDLDDAWGADWVRELWARVDIEEEKRDFAIEKRFWEHVVFRRAHERGSLARGHDAVGRCVARLLDPDYILNGLNLCSGDGHRRPVPATPQRSALREPRRPFAEALLSFRSPWWPGRDALALLEPDDRARFVDAAAGAFARSHFRTEIAAQETDGDPRRHFAAVDALLLDEDSSWPDRFRSLCAQAADAVRTSEHDLSSRRMDQLIASLASNVRVQYIGGDTTDGTRQRAIDGFNTPLYPEVIIATSVLAEGLDLHRFCRRAIHHDLPWNPAKLEQRTGRIDRVGSLSERLTRSGATDPRIHVWLPYVEGTYDQFIFERVIARRREFRCLLGSRPEWEGDGKLGDDEDSMPVAAEIVDRLQVDLGPP